MPHTTEKPDKTVFAFQGLVERTYVDDVSGWPVFVLEPAVFYPGMVAHIAGVLKDWRLPAELVDRIPNPEIAVDHAAKQYRAAAKRLPEEAWALALVPIGEMDPADPTHTQKLQLRALALELCRKWFTRALKNHQAPVAGVALKILRDDDYRLEP